MWPTCVFLVLLLLLPLYAYAQGDTGAGDTGEAEEIIPAEDGVELSAVETEDGVVEMEEDAEPEPAEPEVLPLDQVVMLIWEENNEMPPPFQKQSEFTVVDRPNDEGGGFSVKWMPSPTDTFKETVEVTDEETGEVTSEEQDVPYYEYWVYESRTGEDGSWQLTDSFPTNAQYIWQDPARYGFFLSEDHPGTREHYSEYEFTYPAPGIYDARLLSIDGDRTVINMTASIFDEDVDYTSLEVYCDLRQIGGEKIQLTYNEPPPGAEIWEHNFTGTGTWDGTMVSETKSNYLLVTSQVRGTSVAVIETQAAPIIRNPPAPDGEEEMAIQGSGSEANIPDNRFEHYFKVYVVPAGYYLPHFEDPPEGFVLPEDLPALPDGSDMPPDEFIMGGVVGPVIANENTWNTSRTNTAIWSLMICLAVMGYIYAARRGVSLFLRRIAGLDHVEEAIGRATEMGRPILYTTGLGYVSDIATIASINILGQVAKKVADYETRLINPQRDPIVMAVCQEVVQNAYIDAGRPDAYNKDDIFFITDDQFAYTAAVNGIMVREKPATIILMGMFYAESLLLAETGASTGAIQIAGTDALAQLPFFITACDYTLIGEELYAASAYLSREPLLVGSLKGQDLAKMIFMILTFIGTLLVFMNVEFVNQFFQAF